MLDVAQSGTGTGLVAVMNGLLLSVEKGQTSLLSLPDLSAAFSTVDHEIMLLSERGGRGPGECAKMARVLPGETHPVSPVGKLHLYP